MYSQDPPPKKKKKINVDSYKIIQCALHSTKCATVLLYNTQSHVQSAGLSLNSCYIFKRKKNKITNIFLSIQYNQTIKGSFKLSVCKDTCMSQ